MKLFIVATILSFAAPTYGDHWGGTHYKPENCHGEKFKSGLGLRQYTSWQEIQGVNVSTPYSSQYACEHSSATVNGQYFSQPTRCVDVTEDVTVLPSQFRGEYDVKDKIGRAHV